MKLDQEKPDPKPNSYNPNPQTPLIQEQPIHGVLRNDGSFDEEESSGGTSHGPPVAPM